MADNRIEVMERKRAIFAYRTLERLAESKGTDAMEEQAKKLSTLCRKLPVLLKTEGALRTFAFWKRKEAGSVEYELYLAIQEWMEDVFLEVRCKGLLETFLEKTQKSGFASAGFRCMEAECLELALWMKRNAEGMFAKI